MEKIIKRLKLSVLATILVLASYVVEAQNQFKLDAKSSSMLIKGTSTIHDWEMNVKEMNGGFILGDSIAIDQLKSGNLVVNVESIKSEHSMMDKKTYDALKQKSHPQIKVNLIKVEQIENQSKVQMEVTIAGKTNVVEDNFQFKVLTNGAIEIEGILDITMSDYDVDPPVALMGTIKTGDEITVEYQLIYNKQ